MGEGDREEEADALPPTRDAVRGCRLSLPLGRGTLVDGACCCSCCCLSLVFFFEERKFARLFIAIEEEVGGGGRMQRAKRKNVRGKICETSGYRLAVCKEGQG